MSATQLTEVFLQGVVKFTELTRTLSLFKYEKGLWIAIELTGKGRVFEFLCITLTEIYLKDFGGVSHTAYRNCSVGYCIFHRTHLYPLYSRVFELLHIGPTSLKRFWRCQSQSSHKVVGGVLQISQKKVGHSNCYRSCRNISGGLRTICSSIFSYFFRAPLGDFTAANYREILKWPFVAEQFLLVFR